MSSSLGTGTEAPTGVFEPMRQAQTFVDTIGPIWRRVGKGTAELRFTVEQRHTNPSGTVHGGVLMTLMDLVLGSAVEGALDSGGAHGLGHPITMQLSCSMIGGAGQGEQLLAEASIDRVARSVAFASGRICVGARLLVTAAAVFKMPTEKLTPIGGAPATPG